jgi:hypothetical protein
MYTYLRQLDKFYSFIAERATHNSMIQTVGIPELKVRGKFQP